MNNNSIAFFDFDGTITTKDVFLEFLKFSVPKPLYYINLFLATPVLILYILGVISNEKAKAFLFRIFYKGMSVNSFLEIVNSFHLTKLPKILRKEAIKKIEWHLQNDHKLVVVSANFDLLLSAWCQNNKVSLICTCVEVINGKITGRFGTKNCFGQEKAKRIKEDFCLDEFDEIFVYGDSKGDKEMLELATKKFFKSF